MAHYLPMHGFDLSTRHDPIPADTPPGTIIRPFAQLISTYCKGNDFYEVRSNGRCGEHHAIRESDSERCVKRGVPSEQAEA